MTIFASDCNHEKHETFRKALPSLTKKIVRILSQLDTLGYGILRTASLFRRAYLFEGIYGVSFTLSTEPEQRQLRGYIVEPVDIHV